MKDLFYKTGVIILSGFLLLFLIITSGCKDAKDLNVDEITPPKFHDAGDEGYWRGMAETHTPIVNVRDDNPLLIEVAVPLRQTIKPRHYIEVISLLKNGRQVDFIKLAPRMESPVVSFKIPDKDYDSYSVVVKCNLHDMWRSNIQD